jgi:flagellar hook-length control protein FliK
MFSDIGSSFSGMINQDIPKELLNTNSAGSQKPVFAAHLQKQVEKLDSRENVSSSGTASVVVQASLNSSSAPPLENLDQKKGAGFVSALKEILLKLSKGNLKNFSIDAEGLEALKKMLLTAGFKETDINEAFTGLLEKAKNGKLTLHHLMGKLSDLPLEETTEEEVQPETFLEISALPFLESLLTSLGIKKEDIQNIMGEADKGEKGISLDVIIEKLKNLQKQSFYTQTAFETPETDRNFQHLMKQLGMEQTEEISAPLSLTEFVDALENLRKKLSPEETLSKVSGNSESKVSGNADLKNPISISEKMPDLMNALLRGLEQVKPSEKLPGFGFSYEQIKNEFENRWLLPGDKNTNTSANTLFSANKDVVQGTDTKLKDLNKNLEALLSQEENSESGLESFQRETGNALKQLKTENTKTIDPLQGLGTDAKSLDTQSVANGLRAKPALKDLPAYVTHQVSKSLVKAIHQGESILRLQLKPPELGRLVMTIDNTGNNMKINIMTDNQAAKEILMSNINDIRTALSNSGVTLERFDVDMNSNFQQSMADAGDQAGNSSKRRQRREKLAADSIAGMNVDNPAGGLGSLSLDGSLHYVA